MKIGVLTGIFHPELGGFSTYLQELLPYLQAHGHQVRVLTYGESTQNDYGYPVKRISRKAGRVRRFMTLTREAVMLARESDVLFVVGYALPLPMLRPFARRIVLRVVADASWERADRSGQTTLTVEAYQNARLPLKLAARRTYYRYAVRHADSIVMPSQHVARLVRGWGVPQHKLNVIYNSVADPNLHDENPRALRQALGLPQDMPLLVSIARLTPVKGVDVALAALPYIGHDAKLVIVGDGPQQAALESFAPRDRVIFVGHQEHAAAMRYLRAADVFVLSSRTEGLSHVLLEAQIVGIPCVATIVGGNPEIVTDGENGLLVPSESPQALAESVNRLLAHPEWASQLAQEGRRRSSAFSITRMLSETLAVIEGNRPIP